jgi:two-component system nitrate/nitrite response regulator NarL
MNPISVIVVDDHPLYRSGVVATLKSFADIKVVGEGASADDALRLSQSVEPDILLLDISMPGNGLEAAAAIKRANGKGRIIVLTASEDESEVIKALDAGAVAYALKGIGGDDLASLIRTIADGGSYVAPTLAGRLLLNGGGRSNDAEAQAFRSLSSRETEIARLLTRGLSNKEIARSLGLQEKTVKHYMTQLLQKLQVRNRVEAAMLAAQYFDRKK